MDRHQLESAGRSYPYGSTNVEGLYGVPFGAVLLVIGLSNLTDPPVPGWVLVLGLVLALAGVGAVSLYHRRRFGQVVALRSQRRRYVVAGIAALVVFVVVDQLARVLLGRPPDAPVNTLAASWALGMVVFYLVSERLRPHHVIVWGAVLGAALLPVWGTGPDRDAVAFFPLAAATVLSGLLDHVHLVRAFRSYPDLSLEENRAGR